MNDPIKIIHKFKNNNRRYQYHVYIYLGDTSKDIMNILNKIKDLNMYNSLITLSKREYDKLVNKFGEFWYTKFFCTHHINYTISIIRKTSSNRTEINKKFGTDWYKKHIEEHEIIKKDIFYSYNNRIKREKERKIERRRGRRFEIDDEKDIDYETKKKDDISKLYEIFDINQIKGGGDNEVEDDEGEDTTFSDFYSKNLEKDELLEDEEEDLKEIEDIYKGVDVEPDENILKTSELIQKALNKDNLIKKTEKNLVDFNKSKDSNIHDENIKNVYCKHYITSQYIYKDDTIKKIKNKFICSVKNHEKFGNINYFIPSILYMWSEYFFNEKINKVMIGQKWLRKNELLKIDIEPNGNMGVYEELRGSLKLLKENIKRYGSKIKREEDDYAILYDYINYYMNNELYVLDLYNELGLNYSEEPKYIKNLTDVYLKVYFPKITPDDFKYIINYLNNKKEVEETKIQTIFETINNDLIMEKEIIKIVEDVKTGKEDYRYIFKDNFITQSVIHVDLEFDKNKKIDLFRIFNEFIVNNEYPFVQFQTIESGIIYKFNEEEIRSYHEENKSIDLLAKWFENEPYGLNFKLKIFDKGYNKFMSINLNEYGRIEYKTQWKESDKATIEDIKRTYNFVKRLIKKINEDKNRITFEIPKDRDFKYAFINTIQKFELPDKFSINHNDLSEFSRFFYPYVSLVIEPRKRHGKNQQDDNKGKYGTYLRYKRVSKYDNQARIEQRILYFMRNYDYEEKDLIKEISKQFNITEIKAEEEIEKVKSKYTNIKKSRKVLKKLENIPKYKPPGIGIDIQGKTRDMYKIRIVGARNKKQLDRIISFLAVLIYLYVETYLYKKSERQEIKDKLDKLTDIAKRRNRVDEIVDYDTDKKNVKQMTQTDKTRLGFKPKKGQNQWTRSCQNSGKDKKRRPQQYTSSNLNELLRRGYKYNKKTNMYERKVKIKKGKKNKEYIIRAVKLQDYDDKGIPTGNELYYTCNPEDNGDHYYIGFLTRSNNPYGQCMPCCFKKDPMISTNKEKKDYFLKCIGEKVSKTEIEKKIKKKKNIEKLYILQDTNKIQEGRFGFLPKYLDFFLNYTLDKTKSIKHHYLEKSKTGYFFKYGSSQDNNPFLNAISVLIEKSPEDTINRLINVISNDNKNKIFTAINNGDVRTQFGKRENLIEFLKNGIDINFKLINHFLSIPGVITKNGMNIIGFDKISKVIKHNLEKERVKDDFLPICMNNEESNNIYDPNKDNILFLKENNNFYPIVLVKKDTENKRNIEIIKKFRYNKDEYNEVFHISDYVTKNCSEGFIEDIGHRHTSITAKKMNSILNNLENDNYKIKKQIIDTRNKCKYLLTKNNTIIPVKPSGSIYNIDIVNDVYKIIKPFYETYEKLMNISKYIKTKPIGIYYDNKKANLIYIVSIITETYDIVPIVSEYIETSKITKLNLIMENKPLYDKIDKEIDKGKSNIIIDDRILKVNYNKYYNESYQLFRLHLSHYLNLDNLSNTRNKIIKLINDKNMNNKDIKYEIKKILYKISNNELYELFNKTTERLIKDQKGGKYDRFIHTTNYNPNLKNYEIENNRDLCTIHESKDKCISSPHCHWSRNTCLLSLTKDILVIFINKVSEELSQNNLKAKEILKIDNYFVSDIVDYNRFTERPGQRIIKSTNTSVNRILEEVFGKDNVPKIGKKKIVKDEYGDFEIMNADNPLKDMKEFYIQNIINNNLTVFRAYINGFYWIHHSYYDSESRNLGYYSIVQTELVNYFRSLVIDWLYDNKNNPIIKNIDKYIESTSKNNKIEDIISKLSDEIVTLTNGVVELFTLSKIKKDIPIYIYDDESNLIYLFHDGLIYDKYSNDLFKSNKYKEYHLLKTKRKSINLRFSFITGRTSPDEIEVIYYK